MNSDFLWEICQQQQINEVRVDAVEAKAKAGTVHETIRALELRLEKLTLVSHALWTLLQEKTGITENQLAERVRELDLRDGRLDGRIQRTISICESCGRVVSKRHDRCLYCGSERLKDGAYEGI